MEEHRGSRGGVGEDDTGRRDKERLAGAQKPCTGDNNDGDCKGGKIPSWLDGVGEIIIDHHQCQGTGLVYALDDSVRPKCPCLDLGGNTLCDGCSSHLREERFGNWHKDDCDCQGRGWTASEDGWGEITLSAMCGGGKTRPTTCGKRVKMATRIRYWSQRY